MLEILQFIFSGFWVWCGFTFTTIGIFAAIRGGVVIKYTKKETKEKACNK